MKKKLNTFIAYLVIGMANFGAYVIEEISGSSREQQEMIKSKIKYFKPTIIEGFWGKTIKWEMRDKPLTDKELEDL